MTVLTVVFGSRGATATGVDTISFGRSTTASLKLDLDRTDSSLSRIAGAFQADQGAWHLVNTASRTSFRVAIDGGFQAVLAPGASPLALPIPCSGSVQVQTTRTYVLDFSLTGEPTPMSLPESDKETTTIAVADELDLTVDERRVLVGLGQHRLQNPDAGAWSVPSTSQLQTELSLSPKQIENLINGLALKFAAHLSGLIGTNSGRANTRRHQIVDFAIRSGCINSNDLS